MSSTIAITGANGFIGNVLVDALIKKGYRIKALVHHWPNEKKEGVEYFLYDVAKRLDTTIFTDVDVLLHLAFQFKPIMVNGIDANIYASQQLKALHLPMNVFISSFAAAPPVTPSYYGQTKAAIENIFAQDLIIRPGLVLGNGGLFGKMRKHILRVPFVPLINDGKQIVQTIYVDDLVASIP